MRVLVTGATGFLGRHLVPALHARGDEPVALLLPDEAPPAWLAGTRARIVRGDVTHAPTLVGVAKDCEVVVHLAAAVGHGQRMRHCLRVNRDGTARTASTRSTCQTWWRWCCACSTSRAASAARPT